MLLIVTGRAVDAVSEVALVPGFSNATQAYAWVTFYPGCFFQPFQYKDPAGLWGSTTSKKLTRKS